MLAMLITSSSFTSTARPLASFLPLSLYSTNRVAIGLPMLSLVKLDMMLPPALSSEMLTCGWLYSSWLEVESVIWSPVRITRLYSTTGWPSRVCFTSESPGTRPEAAAAWSTLALTRRNSRVAVAPRISFARAVSWIPGSSTTIRSAP